MVYRKLTTILFIALTCLWADKPCWLDLPKDPLGQLGRLSDQELSEVDELIYGYHLIPKTDASRILDRIKRLRAIEESLLIQCDAEVLPSGKKFLKNIGRVAREKRLYLEELEALRVNLLSDPNYIDHFLYAFPEGFDRGTPLFLSNQRRYDSSLRIYWGEYILEILDPCHRFLTSYFDLWRELYTDRNQDYFAFFVWLEGQAVPFEITSVLFFTEKEKKEKEVVCKNGKLCLQTAAEPFSCSKNKEYLFVIDLDERIFLAEGSKEVRHDSLSFGKPVLAAGNIIIEDGVITRLGLESGHYQPPVFNGAQLLNILRKKGIGFSSEALFDFYYNSEKHSLSLEDFDRKYTEDGF